MSLDVIFAATNFEGPVCCGVVALMGLATGVTTEGILVVLVVTLVVATCVLLELLAT